MAEALGRDPHTGGAWLHAAELEPDFFGRTGVNRFDDPEGEFGVLYAAEDAFGAFIEVYGRDPGLNLVVETDLRGRVLSEIAVEGDSG